MMRDPELALETHAREELGINPARLGSPLQAAAASFLMFAFGALLPLLPWLFTSGTAAIWASVAIGAVAALAVGGRARAVHRPLLGALGAAPAGAGHDRRRRHLRRGAGWSASRASEHRPVATSRMYARSTWSRVKPSER